MLSPDCTVGKHGACSGGSWDFAHDRPGPCPCSCHQTGALVVPATVTAIGRSHVAQQSFKIGPEQLVVVPYCEGSGNTHQRDECQEHGWALVDPGEDDGPVLQTDYRDVADYVAKLWNADHAT